MIKMLRRKISTVWRYLFPTAADRMYLAQIRDSGLFDREFYLASNARLNPLFRIWPERHYVQLGERNGVCPNPGFSPRAYLFHNPDLTGEPRPFLHYIEKGRSERRTVLAPAGSGAVPELPDLGEAGHPEHPAPVALAVHLYYPEVWEELAPQLARQSFAFDLYVTITARADNPADSEADLARRIAADCPGARIWIMPNHGRDILPFVHLLAAGVFAPYRAVCKLHSKKSPHRADGDAWRQSLVAGILGPPDRTAGRLARFLHDPRAGIWVAEGHLHEGDSWWGSNRPRAEALMTRAGFDPGQDPLRFPAGSIYWIKAEVLDQLRRLDLRADDFEPEQALVDGTTAHAVERLMGRLAAAAGCEVISTSALDHPGAGLDSPEKLGQ